MSETHVSEEDLSVLKELNHSKEMTLRNVELSKMHKQIADLTYENTLLKIYLKYGLTSKDGFDQETGEIIQGDEENEDKGTETESTEGTV